ncbi:hypothetical protein L2E82_36293 [Cichorium intybus]|uniref:Uncharacterized protein n=1 Tax=Cichorium intybus TaxID=13427 RepID=A0ACB9BR42_CICIN|nr:hypothetical protein L2E82_36293 [Cichorium intybus]
MSLRLQNEFVLKIKKTKNKVKAEERPLKVSISLPFSRFSSPLTSPPLFIPLAHRLQVHKHKYSYTYIQKIHSLLFI